MLPGGAGDFLFPAGVVYATKLSIGRARLPSTRRNSLAAPSTRHPRREVCPLRDKVNDYATMLADGPDRKPSTRPNEPLRDRIKDLRDKKLNLRDQVRDGIAFVPRICRVDVYYATNKLSGPPGRGFCRVVGLRACTGTIYATPSLKIGDFVQKRGPKSPPGLRPYHSCGILSSRAVTTGPNTGFEVTVPGRQDSLNELLILPSGAPTSFVARSLFLLIRTDPGITPTASRKIGVVHVDLDELKRLSGRR